jgi:uncharacterized protein (DUF58 family)
MPRAPRRRDPVRLPSVWLSARGVWALLGLALVLAVASVVPALVWTVACGAAAFVALAAADALLGPSPRLLRVVRRPIGFVALRRPNKTIYDVENRAADAIRLGLVETPLPTIDF